MLFVSNKQWGLTNEINPDAGISVNFNITFNHVFGILGSPYITGDIRSNSSCLFSKLTTQGFYVQNDVYITNNNTRILVFWMSIGV